MLCHLTIPNNFVRCILSLSSFYQWGNRLLEQLNSFIRSHNLEESKMMFKSRSFCFLKQSLNHHFSASWKQLVVFTTFSFILFDPALSQNQIISGTLHKMGICYQFFWATSYYCCLKWDKAAISLFLFIRHLLRGCSAITIKLTWSHPFLLRQVFQIKN